MANNTVAITLTVDEANALKAWTNQQQAVDKLKQKLSQLKAPDNPLGSVQAGAVKALSTIGQVTVAITGIGSAMAGVMAFANQLKTEYKALVDAQNRASGANIRLAKELEGVMSNLPVGTDPGMAQRKMERGAAAAGIPVTQFANAFSNVAAAATIELPTNADIDPIVERTVKVVQQFPRSSSEDQKTIGGAVGDLQKTEEKLNDAEALGFMVSYGLVSRSPDIGPIAKYGMPGAIKGTSYGADLASSAAFSGHMSQAAIDAGLEVSSAAGWKVAKGLQERFPDLQDFNARLQYVQNQPGLARKLVDGYTDPKGKKWGPMEMGHGAAEAAFVETATAGTPAAQQYQEALRTMGNRNTWIKAAEDKRRANERLPSAAIAKADMQMKASAESAQINNTQGAMTAVAREGLAATLAEIGETVLSQQLAKIGFEMNAGIMETDPLGEVASQMQGRAKDLRRTYTSSYVSAGVGAPGSEARSYKSPEQIERDAKRAEILENMAQKTMAIREDAQTAALMQKAVPVFEKFGPIKEQLYKGKALSPEETQQQELEFGNIDRQARKLASKASSEGDSKAANELMKAVVEMTNELRATREELSKNNAVTEDNTKTMPKPGTTPTPRPANVSSLQNKK